MSHVCIFFYILCSPSLNNDNDDNSSESGSEGTSSIDSSSDDRSKNENEKWSLSTFVKPYPKPIEKIPSQTVPQIKKEVNGDITNNSNADDIRKRSFISPKCLTNEQIKQEPKGNYVVSIYLFLKLLY